MIGAASAYIGKNYFSSQKKQVLFSMLIWLYNVNFEKFIIKQKSD